jgi:hypothetical protein
LYGTYDAENQKTVIIFRNFPGRSFQPPETTVTGWKVQEKSLVLDGKPRKNLKNFRFGILLP